MHISFAAPRYRSVDDVPAEELAPSARSTRTRRTSSPSRRRSGRRSSRAACARSSSAVVLSEQPWIHDPSQTVGKALEEAGLEVLEFVRYALAE